VTVAAAPGTVPTTRRTVVGPGAALAAAAGVAAAGSTANDSIAASSVTRAARVGLVAGIWVPK
jgi:hypothetical protein